MKNVQIACLLALLGLSTGCQPLFFQGVIGPSSPRHGSFSDEAGPSPVGRLGEEVRTLNANTKQFFVDTGTGTKKFLGDTAQATTNALNAAGDGTRAMIDRTRSALAGNPARDRKTYYWTRDPHTGRYLQKERKQKKSLFGPLFAPEEPKQVETVKDWVSLPRPDG